MYLLVIRDSIEVSDRISASNFYARNRRFSTRLSIKLSPIHFISVVYFAMVNFSITAAFLTIDFHLDVQSSAEDAESRLAERKVVASDACACGLD